MNGNTRVWEVNDKMVVSKTIEKAIEVYKRAYPGIDILEVKAVCTYSKDYEALMDTDLKT